jgi:hypothetical protein
VVRLGHGAAQAAPIEILIHANNWSFMALVFAGLIKERSIWRSTQYGMWFPASAIPLTGADTLVVVLAGRRAGVVRQILDRHGARGITPAMA